MPENISTQAVAKIDQAIIILKYGLDLCILGVTSRDFEMKLLEGHLKLEHLKY